MSTYTNAVKNAVVLGHHIVLALTYSTVDTRILLIFHNKNFLSEIADVRHRCIITRRFKNIHFNCENTPIFFSSCFQHGFTGFTHIEDIIIPYSYTRVCNILYKSFRVPPQYGSQSPIIPISLQQRLNRGVCCQMITYQRLFQ